MLNAVKLWDKPEHDVPAIPEDVTDLSDKELMNFFGRFVAWQNYADTLMEAAETEELVSEGALRVAEAVAVAASDQKQVTQAKASAYASPEVREASRRWVQAKAHRKALSLQQNALERSANFLSRELSRRIGRQSMTSRNARWNP